MISIDKLNKLCHIWPTLDLHIKSNNKRGPKNKTKASPALTRIEYIQLHNKFSYWKIKFDFK